MKTLHAVCACACTHLCRCRHLLNFTSKEGARDSPPLTRSAPSEAFHPHPPTPQCIYKQQTVLAEEVVVAGLGGHLSTCSTTAITSRVLFTSVVCVPSSPDSRGGNPSTGGCSQMLVLSTDVALTSDKSEIDAPGRGRQTTVNGQPTQSLQTLATG